MAGSKSAAVAVELLRLDYYYEVGIINSESSSLLLPNFASKADFTGFFLVKKLRLSLIIKSVGWTYKFSSSLS